MKLRPYFTKNQVVTLPNLLSAVRLALIPVLIWVYLGVRDYPLAAIIFIASALTDIADGFIARKFNMTSDLGKALDPIADKLTQLATLICLVTRYVYMLIPLGLLFSKEVFSGIVTLMSINKTGKVQGAEWHGKLTTVLISLMIVTHMLWYDIPTVASYATIAVCIASMLLSLILYTVRHIKTLQKNK